MYKVYYKIPHDFKNQREDATRWAKCCQMLRLGVGTQGSPQLSQRLPDATEARCPTCRAWDGLCRNCVVGRSPPRVRELDGAGRNRARRRPAGVQLRCAQAALPGAGPASRNPPHQLLRAVGWGQSGGDCRSSRASRGRAVSHWGAGPPA